MSFIRRKIELSFAYGTGPYGIDNPRVVTLSGLRVMCNALIAGGSGMGQLSLRIYGMSLSLMNELSTVGKLPVVFRRNTITVRAGDDESGMAQIYQGTITAAWADMESAPDTAFVVTAAAGLIEALLPIPASSYPGSADAAVILSNLADQMGVGFENNGVSVILSTPYFSGSARAQAESCVKAAGIEWNGIENGVLAIWPKGSYRGGLIPLISADTGMVGYPTYTSTGIIVSTLFNPTIRFGALAKVSSVLTPANGYWKVVTLNHEVESELPDGIWFTQMQLAKPENLVVTQ